MYTYDMYIYIYIYNTCVHIYSRTYVDDDMPQFPRMTLDIICHCPLTLFHISEEA